MRRTSLESRPPGRRFLLLALPGVVLSLLLASCSSDAGSNDAGNDPGDRTADPAESATESPPTDAPAAREPQGAVIGEVPRRQWNAMVGAGMVREGCPVTERAQLRRVEVDHVNFKGELKRGHLIVNADTADTTARIFTRLYDEGFPIERMRGVENYDGDTLKSLQDNNTSAYNCRRPDQINAPVLESPHANGRAIDVNPRQNPWMDLRCDCWSPGPEHAERTPGPGKILEGGSVWQSFIDEGWIWQNIDVPDYMHFDTGYPSTPYAQPGS